MIGKRGNAAREAYEFELNMELLGDSIRAARIERNLTQEQLGKLIGVQKGQISKLEKNTGNISIETILKVFNALKAKVNFTASLAHWVRPGLTNESTTVFKTVLVKTGRL